MIKSCLALTLVVSCVQAQQCQLQTIAGNSIYFAGENSAASQAIFGQIAGLVFDRAGNLYVADTSNSRVRKVSPDGIIRTIAGTGVYGYSGDGGPASQAQLKVPRGLALDAKGNLYISDPLDHRIRKVDANGIITTYAGTGKPGFQGDGKAAVASQLQSPYDLVTDTNGNLFITDYQNSRIRKVDSQGIITTVAGFGFHRDIYSTNTIEIPDGTLATQAPISNITGLAVDAKGNLYISDYDYNRIYKIDVSGILTTFAGADQLGTKEDGGPATRAILKGPTQLVFDGNGVLTFLDYNAIRQIFPDGHISTVNYRIAQSLAIGPNNTVYVSADSVIQTVGATVTTVYGQTLSGTPVSGAKASESKLQSPYSITTDRQGALYFVDQYKIWKITADGSIFPVGGTGQSGASPNGLPALSTPFNSISSLGVDRNGTIYILDGSPARVRRINSAGIVEAVTSSSSSATYSATGPVPFSQISFLNLARMLVDSTGNIFVRDHFNQLWWLDQTTQTAKIILKDVYSFALDSDDALYVIQDTHLRLTLFKGTVTKGFAEAPLPSNISSTLLKQETTFAVDKAGNLLLNPNRFINTLVAISPQRNASVVSPSPGRIDGQGSFSAADPLAISELASDGNGNFYFGDGGNHNLRKLTAGCSSIPAPFITSILDTSGNTSLIVPGKILSVYGNHLGPTEGQAVPVTSQNRVPTSFAGVEVLIDDVAAPLLFVSEHQINFIVPYATQHRYHPAIRVHVNGVDSGPQLSRQVGAESSPSVFVVTNADGTVNSQQNPASPGSVITFWTTGEGQTTPAGEDGKIMTDTLASPISPVEVSFADSSNQVLYAGSAPNSVAGLMQVNVQVPTNIYSGEQHAYFSIGAYPFAMDITVTVWIR